MSGIRITKAEMERRVTIVHGMLTQGLHTEVIIRLCREKHGWDVCSRQVRTYVARANALFAKESKVDRSVAFGKLYNRLETQYAKADARKDHRGASDIVEKEAKLLGLYAQRESDMSEVDEFLEKMVNP